MTIEDAGRAVADELLFTADLALVLFQHNPDMIVIVGEDGRIAAANRQAAILTQYPASMLVGMTVDDLLPESVRSNHPGHRSGFLADARNRPMGIGLDLRMRLRTGIEVPVDINLAPVALVQGLFTIATVRRRPSAVVGPRPAVE